MADENQNNQNQQQEGGQNAQQAAAFDYDKLAGILAGRQAANEESVLKGYFKSQGITGEEAAQAIAAFKEQKAKNTPDPAAEADAGTGAPDRHTGTADLPRQRTRWTRC